MHFPWAHTGAALPWVCRTRAHQLGPALLVHLRTYTKLCLHSVTQPVLLQKLLSAQLSLLQWEIMFHSWGDQGCPEGMAGTGCRVPGASESQPGPIAAAQLPPVSFVWHPGRHRALSCNYPSPRLWHKWLKCWNRNPGKDRIHHSTGILHAVWLVETSLHCSPGLPSVGELFSSKNCFFTTSTPYPKTGAMIT